MEVIPMVRGLSALKATTTVVATKSLPGQSWTYSFEITDEMLGAWPFHDHYRDIGMSVNRGLFGGIIVLPEEECDRLPRFPLPTGLKKAMDQHQQSPSQTSMHMPGRPAALPAMGMPGGWGLDQHMILWI